MLALEVEESLDLEIGIHINKLSPLTAGVCLIIISPSALTLLNICNEGDTIDISDTLYF